jgi:hypothetical protein
MRHEQYRDSLLAKLREWRLSNIDGTIAQARNDLRKALTSDEVDLLFDNWLNANFDRIEVHEIKPGSLVATVRARRSVDPDQQRRMDVIARRVATRVKDNLFEDFAERIWNTALPNGIVLRDATGKDLAHATGWYAEIGKRLKPRELVRKKFTTRQLFELSQRPAFARIR